MPASANATMLEHLIDPQVIADYIETKYIDKIRFAPLARIDSTLVGRPGDEVTLPFYQFIGAASAVAEGTDIPIARITQGTKRVKVSKIGKAVEFTDEALLSAYNNDIAEEAAKQVMLAINDKVEGDLLAAMGGATLTDSIATATIGDDIADSLVKFGEDIDGEKVLLCSPALYGAIRKANGWIPGTELAAERIIRGSVGMIHGCEIVVSNRLASVSRTTYAKTSDVAINSSKTYYVVDADGNYTAVATPDVDDIATYYEATTASAQEAYIVKPGALAIYTKRGTMVEFDRDKLCQTNFIIGSKIFAPYLYDENKIIKLTVA